MRYRLTLAIALLCFVTVDPIAAFDPEEIAIVVAPESPITYGGRTVWVAKTGQPLRVIREEGKRVLVGDRFLGWIESASIKSVRQAQEYFSLKLEIAKTDEHYLGRARCLALSQTTEKGSGCDLAMDDCNAALRQNPRMARALAFRSALWLLAHKYDSAIQDANTLRQIAPNEVETYWCMASALSAMNINEDALRFYGEALRLNGADAVIRFERSLVLRNLGRLDDARADLDVAVVSDPYFAAAFLGRAWILVDQLKLGDALADAETALKLAPGKTSPLLVRGRCYQKMGRIDAAIDVYSTVINSGNKSGFSFRGDAWNQKAEYERALADFDQGIANSLDMPEVRCLRCEALMGLTRYQDVLASCNEILREHPNYPMGYHMRALAHAALGEFRAAHDDARQMLAHDQQSARAHALLSALYKAHGDEDAAGRERRLALKIEPSIQFPKIAESNLSPADRK